MARLPKIACIGAGNLASHLLPQLAKHRYEITQVYSRKMSNASPLAKLVGSNPINKLKKINDTADIYMILVPDEHIRECSAIIDDAVGGKDKIITHSSGATSLKSIASKRSNFGVFYPLQSFVKDDEVNLRKVPLLIEGTDDKTERKLMTIARKISSDIHHCDSDSRLAYHLSAVMVNNFTTHLHCKNREFLQSLELDPNILNAIIKQTSEKLLRNNPCKIQTGPAKRGDKNTMRKHLGLIKKDKTLTDIYKEISKSIANYYK